MELDMETIIAGEKYHITPALRFIEQEGSLVLQQMFVKKMSKLHTLAKQKPVVKWCNVPVLTVEQKTSPKVLS